MNKQNKRCGMAPEHISNQIKDVTRKDALIAKLKNENKGLTTTIEAQTRELSAKNAKLTEVTEELKKLTEELKKLQLAMKGA